MGLPHEDWHLDQGNLDLSEIPPEGVFYNRMSASSHTREHRFAPELTAAVLSWLESHGRLVLNDSRALSLEVSKVAQYQALRAHGVRTPHTVAAVGKEHLLEAARSFPRPFITKHNRAGKGLGVQLFHSAEALERYVHSPAFEEPIDGITLLQEYIESPDSTITRCEFIGGKFFYAVRVDTSEGFEHCPADACRIDDAFCPTTEDPRPKFEIIGFYHPVLEKYEAFLRANGIQFAGIEFIRNADGELFTYDVNTNTNYNSDAETKAGKFGMRAIAETLGKELERLREKAKTGA
ncbi:glutathione synthase/RimK-type ligase-like ATP-grasp enzyme [Melghirimyces profundicolus]|uniref:Glutathione synthase/RimK-type ligase-like ATP-grasp enzyme n=1 Tax=Melghirimyces profundicolus TaxID=1242148 RepID=A0A2T6C9D1_9BACL|nr:alpha-L-glutamate ligase [Melghirimyces profundicolus]PTX64925.1 glutathione synthase/RimK-type ligase-like ATP-grasp enzyme [Melghirimyces profundicolus]